MRRNVCTALMVAVFLASGVARADDRAEALKIVNAAIQAAGGDAKLDKLKSVSLKGNGAIHDGEKEASFTCGGTLHGLDHFRFDLEVGVKDKTVDLVLVFSGDSGWRKIGGRVIDTPAEAVPLFKAGLHAFRMAQMLTPLKHKDLTLSSLGEIKINDRAALGIKIVKKDHPDLDLYFDKESHLPVKCGLRIKEPETEQEETYEWLFSGFKEVAGVKHPMQVVLNRDGKKRLEMEISEVKPEENVEETVFAKP